MNRVLAVGIAITLLGCDAPFWVKQKREDAEIAREQEVRAKEQETRRAEETRHLLALCLDIAKFEKQWNNFAEWSFDASTGDCAIEYKKQGADRKTEKQCADEWLTEEGDRDGNEPSASAAEWKQRTYYLCTSETFAKTWRVKPTETKAVKGPKP